MLTYRSSPFCGFSAQRLLALQLCLLGCLSFLTGLSAWGQLVDAGISQTAPGDQIILDIAIEGEDGNAAWFFRNASTVNGHRDIGQTFQAPSSASLRAVVFRISDVRGGVGGDAPGSLFTVKIYSVASAASTEKVGEYLYSGQGVLPGSLTGGDYLQFSWKEEVPLTEGTFYAIELAFESAAPERNLNFVAGSHRSYPQGKGFLRANTPDPNVLSMVNMSLDFQMYLLSEPMVTEKHASSTSPTALPNRAKTTSTILFIGDSTMANQPKESPLQGWGSFIGNRLSKPWKAVNCGSSGASTKTFLTRTVWKTAQATPCDYLFIQFGHNDSHGPKLPESTDADTVFKDNLRFYVKYARDKGIKPVLLTPVCRYTFSPDGTMVDNLAPYAKAVREVAQEKDVPLIDLHALTGQKFLELGPEKGVDLMAPNDKTHFSPKGADWIASLVASESVKIDPSLAAAFGASASLQANDAK